MHRHLEQICMCVCKYLCFLLSHAFQCPSYRFLPMPLATHMLLRLSGWVLGRPFRPWPPWPSVPPPSEGRSMRWNINGVRFCVRYTTWPAGWHQAHSGGRHRTQTQDALAACTHTGAPSTSTWLWVSKVKFPARLLIWDLLTSLNKWLKGHYWL